MAGFTGAHRGQDPALLADADPAARLKDMDLKGVDINLTLPSGWFGAPFRHASRGVILVFARDVVCALEEIAA
jgi:hypothetical protein